jgi:hypothetical protein
VQPLPLRAYDIDRMKHGGGILQYLVACYARSLFCRDFNVDQHPWFILYARGVMASEFAPDFIKENEELRERYPPEPYEGIGPRNMWRPPEQHAEAIAMYRRRNNPAASNRPAVFVPS